MFCFNDTATTEIYTLSLHDALPILLEFFSWPSIFALSMVLAALALVGTTLLVPTSKDPEHAALDLLGAVLSVAGISGVVFAIIEGPALGWASLSVVAKIGRAHV